MGYLIASLLILISALITLALYIFIPIAIVGGIIEIINNTFQLELLWLGLILIISSILMTIITAFLYGVQQNLEKKLL